MNEPTRRRRRWPRRTLLAALLLLALPPLLLVAARLALEVPAVRQVVLERAGAAAERELGVRARADDFSVALLRGRLELVGFELGAPGAAPVLAAERLLLEVDLRSLRTDRPLIRRLDIEAPILDLAAPLPELRPAEPATEPADELRLDIRRARLTGGTVRGAPAEEPVAAWLRAWRIEGIELGASLVGGKLRLDLDAATVVLDRPELGHQPLALEAALTGRLGGRLQLEALRLAGDGLLLTASGSGGPGPEDPAEVTFRLLVEPGRLAPEIATAGRLEAEGAVTLPGRQGHLWLAARQIPLAVAAPFLDDPPAALPELLARSELDLDADLVLGPGAPERLAGTVSWVVRTGGRTLVDGEARLAAAALQEVELSASLLPASPGTRRLDGSVRLPAWDELEAAAVERGHLTLEIPDLAAAHRELVALLGGLLPELPDELPLQGSLRGRVDLAGTLAAPRLAPDVEWRPTADSRVRLTGTGDPVAPAGRLRLEIVALPLELARAFAGDGLAGHLSGHLEATGDRRLVRVDAALEADGLAYPPHLESLAALSLAATGTLAPPSWTFDGEALLAAHGAALADGVRLGGAELRFDGRVAPQLERLDGRVRLAATALEPGGGAPTLDLLDLEAAARGRELTLGRLEAHAGARHLWAHGRAALDPVVDDVELTVELRRPVEGVESLAADLRLAGGVLELADGRLELPGAAGTFNARVPLGLLRTLPDLEETVEALPLVLAEGPLELSFEAPALDSARLLDALGLEPAESAARAGLSGRFELEPRRPAAGAAELEVRDLVVLAGEETRLEAERLLLRLADGTLELAPASLLANGTRLDLAGWVELEPDWNPFVDEPAALARTVSFRARGELDTALANPFLLGGFASGLLRVDANVFGRPDDLEGRLHLSGPEVVVVFPSPYVVRIEAPELDLILSGGAAVVERGTARVNRGELVLAGSRSPAGDLDLRLDISDVRMILDYRLAALLEGRLQYSQPADERALLSGRITLVRGVLDRDLDLDREVLAFLFAPVDMPGVEAHPLDEIDLDLRVETLEGVRVRNNVADLRATWDPLRVRGTVWNPSIVGRVLIDPGSLIFAYGQTLRVDRGALVFTGDPVLDPRLELSTTSSLQDPTLARRRARPSPLDALDEPPDPGTDLGTVVTEGLAGYYGERLGAQLGEVLGLGAVTIRPVVVFGETDPSARLTLQQELSRTVALTFSTDLRNPERQVYLLDLHGFRGLPTLEAQGFTSDEGTYGATLQQSLELGGTPEPRVEAPALRSLVVEAPRQVPRRPLRRAAGLRRGSPLPEGTAFDVEVQAGEALRDLGYPDARVEVDIEPLAERPGRADLRIRVEPGARVRFLFEGDRPPRVTRPSITGLYRGDFYQAQALEDMRARAVQVFRSMGHVEPQVEIELDDPGPAHPGADRQVTIRTEAGPRAALEELRFPPLDRETERLVAARFPGLVARAELAAGRPDADRRLLGSLRAAGYPRAEIAGRRLEAGGDRLVVELDPGPRRRLASVEVAGAPPGQEATLRRLLPLAPGDPARLDLVSFAALQMEEELRSHGHPEATVRPTVELAPDDELAVVVRYDVRAGPRFELARVDFEGNRSTRASVLRREAGLELGEPLDELRLGEARGRLFRSGLFSRVTAETARAPDGEAAVTFAVAERARYRVGYGLRWQSEGRAAAVVDALDRNFLGRGMTLGVRGIHQTGDRRARLFLGTGDLLGTPFRLETFAEVRRRRDFGFIEDRTEAALQLARPLAERIEGRVYLRYRTTLLREEEPDPFFPFPDIRISHPYVGTQLLYDSRDTPWGPTRGVLASLDLSGSGPFLGSDFEYVRAYGQVNLYWPLFQLGDRPVVWAQSVRAGAAEAFDQELLRDVRFFVGGEYSVRGYATESLGPEEVFGPIRQPLGGEAVLVLNQELRVPLPWGLTALGFFDAGQVWTERSDFGRDLAKSVGLGLRADTPLGILRFDAAYPLDRRDGDRDYQLYFGFGNAF